MSIKTLVSPMPFGKEGLFAAHLPTHGNTALCTCIRCLERASFIALSAGFRTHRTSFFPALQLVKKMSFQVSSLVTVWIARAPELDGRSRQ